MKPALASLFALSCTVAMAAEPADQVIRNRSTDANHALRQAEKGCLEIAGPAMDPAALSRLKAMVLSDLIERGIQLGDATAGDTCDAKVQILLMPQRVERKGRVSVADMRTSLSAIKGATAAASAPVDPASGATAKRLRIELYGGSTRLNIGGSLIRAGSLSLAVGNVLEFAGVSGAFNEAVAGDARGFNLLGNPYWDYYYHFQKIEARIERPKDAGPIGRIKTSVLLFSREMDVAGAFAVAWDDFASALFEKPATAEPASGATQ